MAAHRDTTRVLQIVGRLQRLGVNRIAIEIEAEHLLKRARAILTGIDARETRRDPSKRTPAKGAKPASREQRRAAHARRNAR